MALCCGCEMRSGMPVSLEMMKAHFRHTFEVMLFWELFRRPGVPQGDANIKLSQARIDYIEAIETLYPEVKED